jgi:hypothetical protein
MQHKDPQPAPPHNNATFWYTMTFPDGMYVLPPDLADSDHAYDDEIAALFLAITFISAALLAALLLIIRFA